MSRRKNERKFKLELIGDEEAISKHPKYASWKQLKLKCKKESIEFYENWTKDPESYLKWWEDNREDKKVLYRRDLKGPFSPSNCYFATQSEVNQRKKAPPKKPPFKGTPAEYALPPEEKWGRLNGYVTFCDSTHPLSYDAGWVYMHMHMGSVKMGRWLDKDDHVHHVDKNRSNNNLDNLEVMTPSDHSKLHNPRKIKSKQCKICRKVFTPQSSDGVYCSNKCRGEGQIKTNWPSKEELQDMLNKMPQCEVAKKLGVSDQAVYKRCKKLGIK